MQFSHSKNKHKKKTEKGGLSSEAYFLNMLNYQVFSHIKRQLKKMKAIMLNSLLPLLNIIYMLKPHLHTPPPHPPLFFFQPVRLCDVAPPVR